MSSALDPKDCGVELGRAGDRKSRRISESPVEAWRLPCHPYYKQSNELLDEEKFDAPVEGSCRAFVGVFANSVPSWIAPLFFVQFISREI